MVERYSDLPLIARRYLETLSDEKVRSVTLAADVFGDMDHETLALLRNPKPELIKYLAELREEEIKELMNAIELVRAFRRTGRVVRILLVTAAGTFITMATMWDRIASWLKLAK